MIMVIRVGPLNEPISIDGDIDGVPAVTEEPVAVL